MSMGVFCSCLFILVVFFMSNPLKRYLFHFLHDFMRFNNILGDYFVFVNTYRLVFFKINSSLMTNEDPLAIIFNFSKYPF